MKSVALAVGIAVLLALLAACSEAPTPPPVNVIPPRTMTDLEMIANPPALKGSPDGTWQGTYSASHMVFSANTYTTDFGWTGSLFTATHYDVRYDSGRVWIDAFPAWQGWQGITYSGVVQGDSIVGSFAVFAITSGKRWIPDTGIRPLTFHKR